MLPPGEGGEGWLLPSVLCHLELVLLYLLFTKEPTLRRGLEVCDGLPREIPQGSATGRSWAFAWLLQGRLQDERQAHGSLKS